MPRDGEKTFYDILGVAKEASPEELRKAWLELARKNHPDKTGGNKGAEERLKLINEAYDTLKRPEKRREYDKTLEQAYARSAPYEADKAYRASSYSGYDNFGNHEFDAGFGDDWGGLFGQRTASRQRRPQRGRDIETQVSVTFKESATGAQRSIRVPLRGVCESCAGSGAAPGTQPQQCPQCKGSGHINMGSGSLFLLSKLCPLCRGFGRIITTPCAACEGSGFTTEMHTLSLTIPAGVRNGTRLRLAGQGEPGEPGAPAGDLYVVLEVEKDPLFQRKRNDLLCDVPVTFSQATLGAVIEIPTLRGRAKLTIPPGTQSGSILRMRGQGFPALNGGHKGDQLVTLVVEIPRHLTPKQRDVINQLDEKIDPDNYPKHHAYIEMLARWWER